MQNPSNHDQTEEQFRELNIEELSEVSGGVNLGGVLDRIADYLWARSKP